MRCTKCGYENNGNARFCQGCGSALAYHPAPLTERMLCLFNDSLFLALCILCTVSASLSLLSADVPLIRILMCIFLWLLFSQGKKRITDVNYMRCVSGAIFASYVINWILFCLIALCGMLLAILFFVAGTAGLGNRLYWEILPYIGNYAGIFSSFTSLYLWGISAVLIITAIIGIALNILGRRSIHRFAQSLYKSMEHGQMSLASCSAARTWLLVFGIIHAVLAILDSANGSTSSFMAGGCLSAAFIIGYVLVGKYFKDFQ